jgi:hypothetical protein
MQPKVCREFDGPDFTNARGNTDRADDLQERTVPRAFDNADPGETDADDDTEKAFGPRLEQSKERHARSNGKRCARTIGLRRVNVARRGDPCAESFAQGGEDHARRPPLTHVRLGAHHDSR